MDVPNTDFTLAGTLEEVKAKGRIVVHGAHRPILVVYDRGCVFALDNRCPHMGFPLDRGSVEDGILTCHWHHARFDLESGCTFDLWADDTPTFPVEVHDGKVWVKTKFSYADPAAHWRHRLNEGLAHDIGLVIAKAVQGQLAAGVPKADLVRQAALFGAQNRDGWGVGLTILTALANLLPALPEDEAYLDLFHGARHVASGLRRAAAAAGTCAAQKPAGTGHPQALATALDKGSSSRGGRAYPAHGDRWGSVACCACQRPARRRDGEGLRRRRALARFH